MARRKDFKRFAADVVAASMTTEGHVAITLAIPVERGTAIDVAEELNELQTVTLEAYMEVGNE